MTNSKSQVSPAKVKIVKATLVLIGVGVLIALSVTVFRSGTVTEQAQRFSNGSKEGAQPEPGPSLSMGNGQNPQHISVGEPPARVLITKLLTQKPGQISGKEAWDYVSGLKDLGEASMPEIRTLLASMNMVDRILGVYLSLEVEGVSDELLKLAGTDSSPYVSAQAAEWLYLSNQFDQWDSYLNHVASSMTPQQIGELFALLDRNPVRPEVTAAMSILCLGRALPEFAKQVFLRSQSALETARQQLVDREIPAIRRENLLQLFHEANPSIYPTVLREVISQSSDDSSVRWQAIWKLGQTAADSDSLEFLNRALVANPQDPLVGKISQAAMLIEERKLSANRPLVVLEKAIKKAIESPISPQQADSPGLLAFYVEQAKRDRNHAPDTQLLLHAKNIWASQPVNDYSSRQRTADVQYLIWHAARSQPRTHL